MRRHPIWLFLIVCATAIGCSRSAHDSSAASSTTPAAIKLPESWPYAHIDNSANAAHGMVATDAPIATHIGAEVLRNGGNAVDAAVATAFALAVAYPEAGNLGGGGFLVVHMGDGREAALDFREVAPHAASRNMYIGANGSSPRRCMALLITCSRPRSAKSRKLRSVTRRARSASVSSPWTRTFGSRSITRSGSRRFGRIWCVQAW